MGRAVAHQGAVHVVVEQTRDPFRPLTRPALGQFIDAVLGPQSPDLQPALIGVGGVGLGPIAGDELTDGHMVLQRLKLGFQPGETGFGFGHGGPLCGLSAASDISRR
ncbi:hypothetical protein D3C71_1702730 [compost metagenome]